MTKINDIMNWLIAGGGIIYVAFFLCKVVKPFMEYKKNHAATAQSKEAWTLAEQVADVIVASLVSSDKNGQEKFNAATKMLQDVMNANDLVLNDKSAKTIIQAAYEKSPLTGNDKEVPGK